MDGFSTQNLNAVDGYNDIDCIIDGYYNIDVNNYDARLAMKFVNVTTGYREMLCYDLFSDWSDTRSTGLSDK